MSNIQILVVDDESRMRKLVRDFLVKQNFEVLEAGDGAEALDILAVSPSRISSPLRLGSLSFKSLFFRA